MLVKKSDIIKKLENDGGRSIDYYENICRNPDGGTGYNISSSVLIEELTASEPMNITIHQVKKNYHYKELFDFLEYESQIATDELTNNPAIMNFIIQGEREIRKGKKVLWRDVFRET